MADLDITEFLKEGSLVDLDWLNVDEKDYQALDRLPKQNLDIAPDLEMLWSHQDIPAINLIPNKGVPRTMADMSVVHGPISDNSETLVRTARLAMMQSSNPERLKSTLMSRFDRDTLRHYKTALAGVLAERGLLGSYYIDAKDFPGCASSQSKQASDFVRRFANDAKFVVAKHDCGDCQHNHVHSGQQHHCGVFHKEIVVEAPYTEELANTVEASQQARGKVVQASNLPPRERIKQANLASTEEAQNFTGRPQQQPVLAPINVQEQLISASSLSKKLRAKQAQDILEHKARPIIALLRNELLKGRSTNELTIALRLAFDLRDLQETRPVWEVLFKQAGLYGVVYSHQESFEDCREGADFLTKHGSTVRAIVSGEKCGSCIYNQANHCLMYGRKLASSVEEVVNNSTVEAVIVEHKMAGRLPYDADKRQWGQDPVTALKNIHRVASTFNASVAPTRSLVETAFRGDNNTTVLTSDITRRNIIKTAKQFLNEGLYGADLLTVLKGRFGSQDLLASSRDLKVVLAEQGLQGIKYIDPTAYDDYGRGCQEAATKHRSRGAVKYAKLGDKCASCVHHTRPGHCSVLNKELVVEPPYVNKKAEQMAVLASGSSTEVPYEALMNNGLTMMHEFELQHQASSIEIPELKSIEASVEYGYGTQKVKI